MGLECELVWRALCGRIAPTEKQRSGDYYESQYARELKLALYIADPWPGDPQPSETQYAMVGEFGGIGAFQVFRLLFFLSNFQLRIAHRRSAGSIDC